jgi:hypothetical protein
VKLIGHAEVTTIEEPGQLQFVVTRENGWIDLVAPSAVLILVFVWACVFGHFFVAVFSVVGLFGLGAYYLNGPITKLFVSQNQLIARGNLDRTFTNEVKVPASEVKSLGYSVGPSEDSPSGLYADRGWLKQTCLLPGLNKQQANTIADAIRRKFPDLERGDKSPNSLIFSEKSGTVALGLAKTQTDQISPKP